MNQPRGFRASLNHGSWGGIALVIVATGVCIVISILAWRVKPESQLMAVVVGAALTGIFGYLLFWQRSTHEERIETRKFKNAKLEETHAASRSLERSFSANFAAICATLVMPHSDKFVQDLRERDQKSADPASASQLAMLVGFYFPEIRPELKKLEESIDEFGKVLSGPYLEATVATDSFGRKSVLQALQNQHAQTIAAIRAFQDALSAVAQTLS